MSPRNPFTPLVRRFFPDGAPASPEALAAAGPGGAVAYAAEELWEQLDVLPGRAEATLAQRRLEESVFWAGRAGA